MSHENAYESLDYLYGEDNNLQHSRGDRTTTKRQRPTQGRRRGKTPQSVNGLHRRRRKKIAW